MRCPNLICRAVFDVDPTPAAAVAAPTASIPVAEPERVSVAESPFQTAPTVLAPPEPVAAPPAPPPSWATPPPVRNAPVPAPVVEATPIAEPEMPGDDEASAVADLPPTARPRRRISPLVFVGALLVVVVALGIVITNRLARLPGELEKNLVARAEASYKTGDFDEAAKIYQQLQREFPASKDRYRFLATLSALRAELDLAREPAELTAIYEHLDQFVADNENEPLAKERSADLSDTWSPLTKRLADAAESRMDGELLDLARKSWRQAKRFTTPPAAEEARFDAIFAKIQTSLETKARRAQLLALLKATADRFDVERLQAAEAHVKASGFGDDPDVIAAVAELRRVHQAAVRYRAGGVDLPVAPADDLDLVPLSANIVTGPAIEGPENVYVLSPTGVLYAVDPRHGDLRWARRLGIDSRHLPLRLGDGLIAILGDRRSVALLDAKSGRTSWEHPLGSSCVTAPTVVGDRLFVPTIAGKLEIVAVRDGKGLGIFDFPQSLTEEAVLEPGTSRLFVPGNVGYAYVLDLDAKKCVDLIETGHAADSLVEPIWFTKKALVLTESATGPTTRLRPVPLPGARGGAKAFTVAGALAFPTWRHEGVLLLPTPPGKLTQVGRRLPGNADPLLFPLTPFETAAIDAGAPRPALVLHADAENVWMLGQGRVQRLQRTFSTRTGPGLRIRWAGGVPLGDPLHAGQIHVPAVGLPTVFVPFRNGPIAAIAALQGETGKILWRTELGSRPLGELKVLGGDVGWADAAGVFVREASGKITYRREPAATHRLLLGDGRSIGWTGRTLIFDGKQVELPAPIAGSPTIGASIGVFPLADGTGPSWRRSEAEPDSTGTVTALEGDVFLVTDGDGSIAAIRWKDRKDWAEIGRARATKGRIVGAPARLGPNRLVVRDDADRLHRLDVDEGKPVVGRSWSVGTRITQGPFALGDRIAIVTAENRLVVFDPDRDEPLWHQDFPGELVGPPRLVDDAVLIADSGGNLWLLDAATGAHRGAEGRRPVWSARPNLAPAVAPMPLPTGELFVLWTDGTASVLPRSAWRR
jgi:outer membrane protein assembly factor BamB/tetratricopeptide (TPR) repeat protein